MPGVQRFEDYPLSELLGYIDWMPFFNAWEFTGKFPDILTDPMVGEAASNLYADARRMLKQLIAERWLQRARGGRTASRPTRWAMTSRSTPTRTAARRC